jgi:hypothetical protein
MYLVCTKPADLSAARLLTACAFTVEFQHLSMANITNPNREPYRRCGSLCRCYLLLLTLMSMCFSSSSYKSIAYQERRAKIGPGHSRRRCLMSMIYFGCLRIGSHVSDSREFQDDQSLADGFHECDCTLAIADEMIEPPAIPCKHEPRSI